MGAVDSGIADAIGPRPEVLNGDHAEAGSTRPAWSPRPLRAIHKGAPRFGGFESTFLGQNSGVIKVRGLWSMGNAMSENDRKRQAAAAASRQRRLMARIVAGCVSPLVFALALQASSTIVTQRHEMVLDLEEKASVVAKLMVNVVGPSIVMEDSAAVQEGLGYANADPSFAFALALGADGHRAGFVGSEQLTAPPPAFASLVAAAPMISHPPGLVVVSTPILGNGKRLGTLHVALRTRAVEANVAAKAWRAAIISLAGVLVCVVVVLWLARSVARRARDIEKLDGLVLHMRDVTAHVTRMARTVSKTAGSISESADSIASGAGAQASSTDETLVHLGDLSQAVASNAGRAQDLAELARKSETTAAAGEKEAQEAARAMEEIRQASHRIDAITATVGEIAFQTNILALNAAVEAARAGDHGRGFAVVATEIGNLSQRSAESARAIKTLVEETRVVVSQGAKLVVQSVGSLQAIASSTRDVSRIVSEIADACRRQVSTLDSVNGAVERVATVTRSNTEETASLVNSSRGLVSQSTDLLRRVEQRGDGEMASATRSDTIALSPGALHAVGGQ